MKDTFYLVMKVKRSRISGGARSISARKLAKKMPTITEDSVVLRLSVEIPFEYLGSTEADGEIPLEAVVSSCHLVNYGGRNAT